MEDLKHFLICENKCLIEGYSKDEVDQKNTEIEQEIDALKKSVSDGKTKLATSITNKKVPTNSTDTFDAMASNIDKIKLGQGNAQPSDVLSGKTFTNDSGVLLTGTMEELTDITQLFTTKGDNTSIANIIFGNDKWSYYRGDHGGTEDVYASCSSNVARYCAFITGSYHSGASDGQQDSYYKVFYKTSASGSWIEATRQNGVWVVNKNIYGVRVYFHVQSTSSMHRPNLSRHNIIGGELPDDKLPDNLFGNVPQYLREQYNVTQTVTLKASEGKTYLLHCINYWSSAPDGNELDIKSVTNATYYKIVTDEYQERPGGKWVYFSLYLVRLTGNSNAVVSYNTQDTDQQVSIIKVG